MVQVEEPVCGGRGGERERPRLKERERELHPDREVYVRIPNGKGLWQLVLIKINH